MVEKRTTPSITSDTATFTLFPKLPPELQLKIWKHAVSSPRVMQVHCIYPASTRSPSLSKAERCDAEATTPGNEVEFGTDAVPSGLLRACKQSRKIILEIHDGCIESGDRKIRFYKENDVIFLHTTSDCCDRDLPGMWSKPETVPNYRKIFADVRHLAVCSYAFNKIEKDRLHSSSRTVSPRNGRLSLVSEFRSLQTFSLVLNNFKLMQKLKTIAGDIRFQTPEEACAPCALTVRSFISSMHRLDDLLENMTAVLHNYKEMVPDDWQVPSIKFVDIQKVVSLGGDKWTRSENWLKPWGEP